MKTEFGLNRALLERMNISGEDEIRLTQLHRTAYKITQNPELWHDPVYAIKAVEFEMQRLWGFPLDETKHRHTYKLKGCTCPTMDNLGLPDGLRWRSYCKWHNPEET